MMIGVMVVKGKRYDVGGPFGPGKGTPKTSSSVERECQ